MTHTTSIRTISIFAAVIGLLAIVLMTAQGNPALAQSLPSVSFTETSIEVDEPDNSPYRINAILTVQLSQASSQTITVQYRTEDFTAKTATRDYIATSGTLYFYPGTTERTISVTVLDDTTVEESFRKVQGSTVRTQQRGTRFPQHSRSEYTRHRRVSTLQPDSP